MSWFLSSTALPTPLQAYLEQSRIEEAEYFHQLPGSSLQDKLFVDVVVESPKRVAAEDIRRLVIVVIVVMIVNLRPGTRLASTALWQGQGTAKRVMPPASGFRLVNSYIYGRVIRFWVE